MKNEIKEYTSCFLGIPLPEQYQIEFEKLLMDIGKIYPDLETVYPETPHLTIYYLDRQSQLVLPEIVGTVAEYSSMLSGCSLKIGNLGFFRPGDPRVLFLKVKYPLALTNFNEVIATKLVNFTTEDDNLPFHPHMTVARMETEMAQLSFARNKSLLEKIMSQIYWNFPITELVLYGVDSIKQPELHERLITIPVL